jgi:hypothetical protein
LTPLEEGLRTYLDPNRRETVVAFDRDAATLARPVAAASTRSSVAGR